MDLAKLRSLLPHGSIKNAAEKFSLSASHISNMVNGHVVMRSDVALYLAELVERDQTSHNEATKIIEQL